MEVERGVATPITPVKVEMVRGFSEFLSLRSIDLSTIQVGTLSNGIFEKKSSLERSNSTTALGSTPHLRKMHSMF